MGVCLFSLGFLRFNLFVPCLRMVGTTALHRTPDCLLPVMISFLFYRNPASLSSAAVLNGRQRNSGRPFPTAPKTSAAITSSSGLFLIGIPQCLQRFEHRIHRERAPHDDAPAVDEHARRLENAMGRALSPAGHAAHLGVEPGNGHGPSRISHHLPAFILALTHHFNHKSIRPKPRARPIDLLTHLPLPSF